MEIIYKCLPCLINQVVKVADITNADEYAYTLPLDFLPMAYVYEAAKRGVISIENNKNYPVMYVIKK